MARLAEATVKVLRKQEFSGLTVRSVAAEAGVGTATAYTYFASKEHLVAEVFWRRLQNSSALMAQGWIAPRTCCLYFEISRCFSRTNRRYRPP